MKIILHAPHELSVCRDSDESPDTAPGWIRLNVSHCAICRTDAKMWDKGHRDLMLPRVPGHEIVGLHNNKRYAVWPGVSCGACAYCKSDRENLCDSMQILGFHLDGGFSDTVAVPKSNCIELPGNLDSATATFAEPSGCIINALEKAGIAEGTRLLIYGAGTMGILTALLSLHFGAIPVVAEKNHQKIRRAEYFSGNNGIVFVNDPGSMQFDMIINCCADPYAFASAILSAGKGASLVFFSGLDRNGIFDSDLLNLIHYRELRICGSYGLTKNNLLTGLQLISRYSAQVEKLIERIITPDSVPQTIHSVLSGEHFKYIISF